LTRQRLAEAAFAEFEARGYAQCSVEDIARRAGVSRATFYVHYQGKVELVEGLWDVVRRPLVALYRELLVMDVRDQDTLAEWLSDTFAVYKENKLRLVAVHEAIALEASLADAYFERENELVGMISPLLRPHLIATPEEARSRAALLTIQHERFCVLWILRGVPFDHDSAVSTLASLWVDQLGTTP